MKILIVHRLVSRFGGAHKYLVGLTRLLRSAGWDVTLIVDKNEQISSLLSDLKSNGVKIIELQISGRTSGESGAEFDQIVLAEDPDVIDFEAASKVVRGAALESHQMTSSGATKLFTMHLPLVTDKSGIYSMFRWLPFSRQNREYRARKRFLELFDLGLSVSSYYSEKISNLFGLDPEYFVNLPNGVDVNLFKPRNSAAGPEEPIRIVACGGLIRQKRFDLLIRAVARLKQEFADFDVRIAGEGVERDELVALAKELAMEKQVAFIGHTENIPAFLQSGDIFVMCSDSEGFPFAALEAMSTGLACVVSETGDLPLIVRDEVDGLTVRCGDINGFSAALGRLCVDAAARNHFGEAARNRVLDKYDSRITWRNTEIFFREIAVRTAVDD